MEESFQTQIQSPKRNLPRDVFLHLLAMVTMYWSAVSFITLCWQYINYFFPDPLLDYYGSVGFSGPMRFAMASLIIVFPLFLLVSWMLNKIYAKESVVRESKIRKWLIYLTLFVTSLVIIGDLISIINTLLNGELTTRFILKALSVLAVAAVIFWYYLDDVKRPTPSTTGRWLAVAAAMVIAILWIGAFFVVGTPGQAREAQFDNQRISDLQTIQYQIINYWQLKEKLPESLADLKNSISGYEAPNDPQTNEPYEYTANPPSQLAPTIASFSLCATFNAASERNASKSVPVPALYQYGESQNWNHPAGHFCFERIIDQDLYPPLNTGK